ncbi:MAG: hypoxanthine phosphoribosyltransferase [Thermodesulfobacteriota bacterium]
MQGHEHPLVEILTAQAIQARVRELGAQISAEVGDEPVLLGVLKGAFVFLGDLARAMTVPVQVDFVRLASYGADSYSSGTITMTKPPELNLKGRAVVVVEDIVDTGRTLRWLIDHLTDLGARSVKVCAFIDKPERREVPITIDYVGFHVPQGFLVGYGLDFDERYRQLAGVYEVKLDRRDG